MELHIGRHKLPLANNIVTNIAYDSIASTFAGAFYFNSDAKTDRSLFRPGSYQTCKLYHENVLILTGTILSHRFASSGNPPKHLVHISGYSRTGVLGDSSVLKMTQHAHGGLIADAKLTSMPPSSLMFKGLNLQRIAEQVCQWYGLKVVVDKELENDTNFKKAFPDMPVHGRFFFETKPDQTAGDFLSSICKQKNVVLSHTRGGDLLLTRAKADRKLTTSTTFVKTAPVGGEGQAYVESTSNKPQDRAVLWDFSKPGGWTRMELSVNGQKMHRIIQVLGQQQDDKENVTLDSAIVNPYVSEKAHRFVRVIQTTGDFVDTPKTARSYLGAELLNIELTIDVASWTLGGHLITPNQMVTVQNPDLHLYKSVKWFIRDVAHNGTESEQIATIKCVLPECFNEDPVKNKIW